MTFDGSAFELNAEAKEGKSFGRISPGTYNAVCTHVIDLGTSVKEGDKWEYESRSVFLNFSFEAEQVKEDENGNVEENIAEQEVSLWKSYSLSFSSGSNLYKDVSSWLGSIPDDQAKKFNVFSLIGKPLQISISEGKSKKTGKKYAKISSLWGLMKWLSPYTPTVELNGSMMQKGLLNEDLFKYLPPFAKEDAENSKEYFEITGKRSLDQDEADIEAEIAKNKATAETTTTEVSTDDVDDIFGDETDTKEMP
mgnify:CR=1 FL=1